VGRHLKAGYKIATNDNSSNTLYTDIDPVTGVAKVNNGRTNAYELDETVYALYGSYQMRLNERWGALAGLRAEYTDMDINQITGGVKASNNYINYIPVCSPPTRHRQRQHALRLCAPDPPSERQRPESVRDLPRRIQRLVR
jgi:outer membrane receptor protein involved in Fe transport